MLLGIDQLEVLVQFDVAGGDFAFLVDGEEEGLRLARMGAKEHLLEVQDDVGDILDHAFDGGEFVLGAIDLDGGDGGAFQGGEEDAAQGVADGVAVAGFKRFGDEFGVGIGGGCVLFGQPLGHFKTS